MVVRRCPSSQNLTGTRFLVRGIYRRQSKQAGREESPADKSYSEFGKAYRVDVGERGFQRVLNKGKLYTRLGKAKFIDACNFTLTAAQALMTGEEFEKLYTWQRVGYRKVEVTALPVAE